MSNPKFTKGIWSNIKDFIAVIDQSDSQSFGMSMSICHMDTFDFDDEWKDNAHLIAAAPDMYAMLEELREAINSLADDALGCVHDTPDRQGWYIKDEKINSISNLLAKARGEM